MQNIFNFSRGIGNGDPFCPATCLADNFLVQHVQTYRNVEHGNSSFIISAACLGNFEPKYETMNLCQICTIDPFLQYIYTFDKYICKHLHLFKFRFIAYSQLSLRWTPLSGWPLFWKSRKLVKSQGK